MTDKEKQRELIVEIMKADEDSGLYDKPARKQTAVDWLFNRLWETPKDKFDWQSILKEAKQREKMQIESAHRHGASDFILHRYKMEQYYKDTYENE